MGHVARVVVVGAVLVPVAACATTVPGTPAAQSSPSRAGGGAGTGDGSGAGEQELRRQAERYVAAVNNDDEAGARALTCSGTNAGVMFDASSSATGDMWRIGEIRVDGPTGFVDISLDGASEMAIPTPFRLIDGRWCIAI